MKFLRFKSLFMAAAAMLAACLGSITHAATPFEDTMAQRTLACTTCHGKEGRAGPDGYYPRIAGKPAGYLYNQLVNLRDGRRHYALMAGLLAPLSDSYLMEMAQYFSALDVPYPAPLSTTAPADVLLRGRSLATQGDAARQIPACTQCHGTALTGVAPNIPGLLGLPRDYLNAQLGGWQTGQRHAHAPDCMAKIAQRMSAPDVNAVATWLATQSVPANAKPAGALPPAQPGSISLADLSCGSAPASAAVSTPLPATTATDLSSPVARGAYLARAGNCMACHTTRGGVPYAGGRAIDTPFGTVFSSNLTPDPTTGLGSWTAEHFWQALHNGKSKDGHLLYPAFPYTNYTRVTRADSDALYAYLRSLPATKLPNTPHALRWPYGTQAALWVWRTLYFSPGNSGAQERGAYLVQGLGHCSACHAARNALGATGKQPDLAGGLISMQNWYAPSLTSRAEASVADWDVAQIVALLKTGAAPRGAVLGPMAEVVLGSTQHLNDDDLTAMAVYLKTLPQSNAPAVPIATPGAANPAPLSPSGVPVNKLPPIPSKVTDRGANLYEQHCAQCHGDQGAGVAGAYPALAGNRAVTLASSANLTQIVINGGFAPATAGNPRPFGMPPYKLVLDDADVAAVLTHIRRTWGNDAAQVTELEVNRVRAGSTP
jgi:cytochrome c553